MEDKSVVKTAKEKQQTLQLIVFRIGDEEFGVPISAVQEIIKIGTITPIPDSPDFIRGLINVRGDIVAIIDVRVRFSLSTKEELPRHIIIAQQEESLFGLMVDEVMEVLRIQDTDIKPPPALMTKIHEEYVSGVITHNERLIILLDINHVLSEAELIKLTELARNKNKFGEIAMEEIEVEKNTLEAAPKKRNNAKNKKGIQE